MRSIALPQTKCPTFSDAKLNVAREGGSVAQLLISDMLLRDVSENGLDMRIISAPQYFIEFSSSFAQM